MTGINDKQDLLHFLNCTGPEEAELYQKAVKIRKEQLGHWVYLRGLIELSNICRKNCFYCGIRRDNHQVQRYELTDEEVTEAARYAWQHQYGSIVLQSGERQDKTFIKRIENLLKTIRKLTGEQFGITLSLGEQTEDTYRRWFEAGAHRYLLRIETSNPALYQKIHPADGLHSYHTRLKCIETLQKCGYKTGSGVMIGLPFQTTEDLAEDLLFLKRIGIHMVGMGPYLEHEVTPLFQYRHTLLSPAERLRISLHMVACLRLLLPEINIAATTALQAIDPYGREKALCAGANVIMPNITPFSHRVNYKLYQNKPCMEEGADEALKQLAQRVEACHCRIAYGCPGNPR